MNLPQCAPLAYWEVCKAAMMALSGWTWPQAPATPFWVKNVACPPEKILATRPARPPPELELAVAAALAEDEEVVAAAAFLLLLLLLEDASAFLLEVVGSAFLELELEDAAAVSLAAVFFLDDVGAGVEEASSGSSSQSSSSPSDPGEIVEVAKAALADARAEEEGAQSGARSSFKFSVANMGWQHLSK